jgi:hypothetical protein
VRPPFTPPLFLSLTSHVTHPLGWPDAPVRSIGWNVKDQTDQGRRPLPRAAPTSPKLPLLPKSKPPSFLRIMRTKTARATRSRGAWRGTDRGRTEARVCACAGCAACFLMASARSARICERAPPPRGWVGTGVFAQTMLHIHGLRKNFPYFGLTRTFYHGQVG